MGVSDSLLFPWYEKFIQENIAHIDGNVGFFGAPNKNRICQFVEATYHVDGELFDIQLNNWDINKAEWNIHKKFSFIICLRTAYFAKDPEKLLNNFHKILQIGGALIIDWGLGSSHFHRDNPVWTFGWEYEGSRCYAEYQGNRYYPWSTFWDNCILQTEPGKLLIKYAKSLEHYRDVSNWGYQIASEFQNYQVLSLQRITDLFQVTSKGFFNTAKFRGKNALYLLFCLIRDTI